MKRITIALFAFLAMAQTAGAQDAIENIRERYAGVKEMIARMEPEQGWPPEYYHLKVVQNLPGTGYHEENVRMYFGDEEVDEIYPPHKLYFVSSKYNFAAREFYEEYLFDDDGRLIFIYALAPDAVDGKESELRFYLTDGNLIKTLVKNRPWGSDESFKDAYSGKFCPQDYKPFYQACIQCAAKFKHLFKAIDNSTYK